MKRTFPKINLKVLLVDDDIDFVEVNRSALETAGLDVMTAYDSDEGMKKATEGRPDLIVLDVMMRTPDEGFDLARRLRKDASTQSVPLIMLTSVNEINRARGLFTFSDADRDGTWLPIDRFLEKPITTDKLISTIREMHSTR